MDFSKGLIPAIIIDDQTEQTLMLAYMNEEAFAKTCETKETWFYSRSRQDLWHKGATSGNKQRVKKIFVDCDQDTLLIRVDPLGPACHTGRKTCFYREFDLSSQTLVETESVEQRDIYSTVMDEILQRKAAPRENSYTNYLFEKGTDKIGKKVIEEAGEVVIAAKNQSKEELINETSDLLYHSFVMLAEQNVSLSEVEDELKRRFTVKGNFKGERKEIKKW
nr:bifunctional phosphoribosyl-AMP cyclohydrolase/phosphoribosyl-ATP diphosphatase HisIE [Pullulanibacillus pueri]